MSGAGANARPLDEYNAKGRYTQGNWATDHRRLDEIGTIVAARVVHSNDHVTVMTANGIVLRTEVDGISQMGRSTRGVRVVHLQDGDVVAALAVLTHEDLNREIDGGSSDDEAETDGAAAALPPAVDGIENGATDGALVDTVDGEIDGAADGEILMARD